MFPDLPPAAEGELGATPFAHLAVYALDKRITGELFLTESPEDGGEEVTHVLRFENGVPTKIKMGDGFALLGSLLVEQGLIDEQTLESALATRGSLLGDMLVLGGCVEPKAIDDALLVQFERRMCRFYSLGPATKFKYFDKAETLASWGGDASREDPFRLLWKGIEAHGECSTAMEPTLKMLEGTAALTLHARAPYTRFGLEGPAADVVDVLSIEPTKFEELLKLETAEPDLVCKVLYALTITRQLETGKGGLPVGVEERPAHVAKVQLKSTTHRRGVAIDAPADGERTPIRPITIRRGHSGSFELIPREEDVGVGSEAGSVDIVGPGASTSREAPVSPRASSPEGGPRASSPEAAPKAAASAETEAAPAEPSAKKAEASPPPSQVPATEKSARSARVQTAAVVDESKTEDQEEPSQQRIIADALRGMPVKKLVDLAVERVEEKDAKAALEICKIAREAEPEHPEVLAVAIWANSLKPGADLMVFGLELDEVVQYKDGPLVRYVRGVIRKRLGEDKGALSDFKRAIELDEKFERAKKEIASLERPPSQRPPAQSSGLLKRLFGR